MVERRRLPVLQNDSSGEPDDEARPAWHWVGFGTVAIFAAWLPLAYVGGAVAARIMAARFGADASKEAIDLALATMTQGERARLLATVALPTYLGLALAAFGGGLVVGRFSKAPAPARVAAAAGAVTACVAVAVAWMQITLASVVGGAVTMAVATAFAAWGGRLGGPKRPA